MINKQPNRPFRPMDPMGFDHFDPERGGGILNVNCFLEFTESCERVPLYVKLCVGGDGSLLP